MSDENDSIEPLITGLLGELGEDPARDGLLKTPSRVAKAMRFFTSGYEQDPKALLNDALFDVEYDEMVLIRDIDFYSLCEHHILPFFGKAAMSAYHAGRASVLGLS